MDQGLAAVLGAGIGVLGTVVTAWLTYTATRRQAIDNGKVDHWHKLRDERKETYLSFLGAVEEFQTKAARLHAALLSSDPEVSIGEAMEAAGDRFADFSSMLNRVELAGPEALVELAMPLGDAVLAVFSHVHSHVRGGTRPTSESSTEYLLKHSELINRKQDFVRKSREILEEIPNY